MKICPQCHDEYRDEIILCLDCNIPLQPFSGGSLPQKVKESKKEVDFEKAVKVFEGQLPACKEMRELLEKNKIPVLLAPLAQKPGTYFLAIDSDQVESYASLMKSQFEEMVAKEHAKDWKAIDVNLDEAEITCPACGFCGALENDQCKECGLVLAINE